MKTRVLSIALALFLMVGLLSACGSNLPAVYVQSVSSIMGYGDLGQFNTCAGVVVAQNEVKINKDESRTVAEMKVKAGQQVAAGDVLFVYDTDQMQLTIDRAKLEIEQMKNSVTDMTAQIAELEKEKAKASADNQLSYTVQIQALETDKKEAEYNITVKERELEALQNEDTSGAVYAPIDGTVKSINENGGVDNYTGEMLPFITLIQSGAFRVKGSVNELNRSEFFVGQTVILRSRTNASDSWTGTITEINENPEENSGSNFGYYVSGGSSDMTSSSTYPFFVELDSTDGLLLGQHLYIEPNGGQGEQKTGLWLDESYIVEEDGAYYVWAADGSDKLEKRGITVGEMDEMLRRYEILKGLTVDDRLAFPAADLQEGAPVTDTPPEETQPDGGEVDEPMQPEDNSGDQLTGDDFEQEQPDDVGDDDFAAAEDGDFAIIDGGLG